MAGEFVIKLVGLRPLQRAMARRQSRLSGGKRSGVSKKANSQALAIIDKWIQKNFEQQGRPAMGGWQPLKQATIDARRHGKKKHLGTKILIDTASLKDNWKHYATERTSYIRSAVKTKKGYYYGLAHQKGRGVPERRILPTNEQIRPQLRKHYEWFMRNAIR